MVIFKTEIEYDPTKWTRHVVGFIERAWNWGIPVVSAMFISTTQQYFWFIPLFLSGIFTVVEVPKKENPTIRDIDEIQRIIDEPSEV